MKLIDLHPRFCNAGGPGITRNGEPVPLQTGAGLICDCPCGCGVELYVPFSNSIGTGPDRDGWQRTGETFETLTLHPSIRRDHKKGGCGWHGWIRNGEVILA